MKDAARIVDLVPFETVRDEILATSLDSFRTLIDLEEFPVFPRLGLVSAIGAFPDRRSSQDAPVRRLHDYPAAPIARKR